MNYLSRIAGGSGLLAVLAVVLTGCHSPAPVVPAAPRVVPVSRPIAVPVYDGRILSFDPVRRYLTLAEVRQDYPPATPIPGLPVADQGVDGKPLGAKDNTLTFQVARDATITVGKRRVALGDLRADMWARVWTRPGTPPEVPPDTVLTAERIEARTGPVLSHEEQLP